LIQVGQVLDKYELLERVGQGGMAVVYRGIDRSLKRTVAVKILHKHLSDYQEARDRFEREAQAVAKLRHENILEIFDYSAKEGEESYIVTEFIDGQTLKQFITERPIAFPEIGAMVILQVCRALAHAHAGAILHRDVKPENIMIRSDGVVKLMDFGISHMVDLERLTVTGQLLGSPAYMAPEHVEGRPLDFRTDVFAVGIVLYQLTVGKLPFEGKNPHEVLKRIAECRFVDPRQANPRIGNRLGRIILRAMAAQPKDRYPAIGEMVLALEKYLEESGLSKDKVASELARYFQAPVAYETALKERLVDHLTRRGQKQLDADDRAGALDAFDRVLTIDANNAKVLAILDGINRRTKLKHVGIAVLAAGVICGSAFAMHEKWKAVPDEPPQAGDIVDDTGAKTHVVKDDQAPLVPVEDTPQDAGPAVVAAKPDAETLVVVNQIDAGFALAPVTVALTAYKGSQYRIDGGPWITADSFSVDVRDRDVVVEIQNKCCETKSLKLNRDSKNQTVAMAFRMASITPLCEAANASVLIDGAPARLKDSYPIRFDANATSSTKSVKVVFTDGKANDSQDVQVSAGVVSEVKCALH
jgi:tRNA A-37 threonylcarbamoyl transferase component Bud32